MSRVISQSLASSQYFFVEMDKENAMETVKVKYRVYFVSTILSVKFTGKYKSISAVIRIAHRAGRRRSREPHPDDGRRLFRMRCCSSTD